MKSLLHFLANRGIYKNGFFILPGPVEKKRDESPGPPDCKYLVPFPSPQNAPNPPSASSEFYAFSSKHCGNSQKALHLPGGRTGISGIFLIYIVGQKKRREHIAYVCPPPAGTVIFNSPQGAPPPPFDYAATSMFSMKMP